MSEKRVSRMVLVENRPGGAPIERKKEKPSCGQKKYLKRIGKEKKPVFGKLRRRGGVTDKTPLGAGGGGSKRGAIS